MSSRSLKTRMILSLLPALVPVAGIVAYSYWTARNQSLGSAEAEAQLLVAQAKSSLRATTQNATTSFRNWTREDVFGMSIEFNLVSELKDRFTQWRAASPEFSQLTLVDVTGQSIVEVAGETPFLAPPDWIASIVASDKPAYAFFPAGEAGVTPAAVYAFPSKSSAGKPVGVFLAFMDWALLAQVGNEALGSAAEAGLPNTQAALAEAESGTLLQTFGPEGFDLTPEAANALASSDGVKQIKLQDSRGEAISHIEAGVTAELLEDAGEMPRLAFVLAVPEGDMLTAAREALKANLAMLVVAIAVMIVVVLLVVRRVDRDITNFVSRLSEVSAATRATATQLDQASQRLHQGSTAQAAAVEETSASIAEIAAMARQNGGHAQAAKESSGRAKSLLSQGISTMETAQRNVRDAAEAGRELADTMNSLRESSQKVSRIVKTIDEIAFQTNILALNAAVEAARAGEAGMGFAVVAGEVRNLAARSAEAAKETERMIEESLKQTEASVGVSARVDAALRDVVAATDRSRQELQTVFSEIENTDKMVAEVASASGEQITGTEQIRGAAQRLETGTQETAACAEQSAAATNALSQQAESISQAVVEMECMVFGGTQRNSEKTVADSGSQPPPPPQSQPPAETKSFATADF